MFQNWNKFLFLKWAGSALKISASQVGKYFYQILLNKSARSAKSLSCKIW